MKLTPLQYKVVKLIEDGNDTTEKLTETGMNRVSVSLTLNNLTMKGIIGYGTPIKIISTDFELDTSARAVKTWASRKSTSKPEPIQTHVAAVRKCLSCGSGFQSEWKGHRVCNGCKQTDTWIGAVQGYDMPQRRAG